MNEWRGCTFNFLSSLFIPIFTGLKVNSLSLYDPYKEFYLPFFIYSPALTM